MTDYELELRLIIMDFDCTPEDISSLLNLTPDHVAHKGAILRANVRAKRNYWHLSAPVSAANSSVRGQWSAIHKLLIARRGVWKKLPANAAKKILVKIQAYKYKPAIEIDYDVMRGMTDFGLSMEVVVYDFTEDDDITGDGGNFNEDWRS